MTENKSTESKSTVKKVQPDVLLKPSLSAKRMLSYFILFFILFVLLAAVVILGLLNYFSENLNSLRTVTHVELDNQKQIIEELAEQLYVNQEEKEQLRYQWQQLRQAPDQRWYAYVTQLDEQWLLALEVEEFLRHVYWQAKQGNAAIASMLLDEALQRLMQQDSLRWESLKQAMQEDERQLTQFHLTKQRYLAQLQELTRKIQRLEWSPQKMVSSASPAFKDESSVSFWQRVLASLRQLVVIRRYETPIQPLLTAEAFSIWQQRLLLYLDQMQLAQLRQQAALYAQLSEQFRHTLAMHALVIAEEDYEAIEADLAKIMHLPELPALVSLQELKQLQSGIHAEREAN